MKRSSLFTLFALAVSSSSYADGCPDISGVYLIDSHSVTQRGSIDPSALKPGSCQYRGEGSAPFLIGRDELKPGEINPTNFPNGLRVYVFATSADNCKYTTYFSAPPKAGTPPKLDVISYSDFKKTIPSSAQDIWNQGLMDGAVDLTGFKQNADGSILAAYPGYTDQPSSDNGTDGIHGVTSTYNASTTILANGDILEDAYSEDKGWFLIIYHDTIDATTCLFQKIQE